MSKLVSCSRRPPHQTQAAEFFLASGNRDKSGGARRPLRTASGPASWLYGSLPRRGRRSKSRWASGQEIAMAGICQGAQQALLGAPHARAREGAWRFPDCAYLQGIQARFRPVFWRSERTAGRALFGGKLFQNWGNSVPRVFYLIPVVAAGLRASSHHGAAADRRFPPIAAGRGENAAVGKGAIGSKALGRGQMRCAVSCSAQAQRRLHSRIKKDFSGPTAL